MVGLLIHYMAPIMFMALVVFLLLGYPVAFSLAAVGLIFGFIGIEVGLFRPDFLQALPERIYGIMNNDVLLAIPFFTFMGLILERSGMAEDLLDTIGQLFGTIRGGLAYAVIFVGALLAATTGVVAASVISMGLISLPIMLRYGYDRRVATGIIAASGTLAQIIPPSLVLIVMADQLGKSVGDMYEGAFIPGLVLAGLYAGYAFLVTLIFPKAAPGLPPEAIGFREKDGSRGLWSLLALFIASCFFGWDLIRQAVESTAKLSAFVVFILVGARVFSLTFYGVNGHVWVEHLLTSLPGGQIGFLIFVNAFVFVLAFFLDFFELAFIVIPLLGPAAEKLGIDLIWFGVILGVNMQTSFMHPPFGFALFYLRSVAPRESFIDRISGKRTEPVTTGQIYWGAVPFVVIQAIMVGLVIGFPALVMHYKGLGTEVDPSKVRIEIQAPDIPPPPDFGPPPNR